MIARNSRASLIFYEQADIRTVAPALSPGLKANLLSHDLRKNKPLVQSQVINETGNPFEPYDDPQEIGGGFSIQADPVSLGYLMKWVFGNPETTVYRQVNGLTVTAGGTGYATAPTVTISAPEMPGGRTATATATVSGGAVTALTLTDAGEGYSAPPTVAFAGGGGADATATTTIGGNYTHMYKLDGSKVIKALTIERKYADIVQVLRAWGCRLGQFNFDAQRAGLLTLPFTLLGLGELRTTSPIDATPLVPPTTAFRHPKVSLKEAGVAFSVAQRFALDLNRQLEGIPVLGNDGMFYDVIEGIGLPTGTLGMWVENGDIYDKAEACTESSLEIDFKATDGNLTNGLGQGRCRFLLPEVKYEMHAWPVSGGTGPIPTDVAFQAFLGNNSYNSSIVVYVSNSIADHTVAIA